MIPNSIFDLRKLLMGCAMGVVSVVSSCASASKYAEPAAPNQLPAKGLDSTRTVFYQFTPDAYDGSKAPLSVYEGQVVLVVNTASKCGFTPQFEGLEALYKKYKDQGLVVLGFPSNDFGGQDPGTNEEIHSFCKLRYGVTFPLFDKNPVSGEHTQPLFRYLVESGPESDRGRINWNFEKFLISPKGEVIAHYRSTAEPIGGKIEAKVKELLPQVTKRPAALKK